MELGLVESLSHETVRLRLKKNALKPWRKQQWCIPKVSSEYVAAMEDVLDLYSEPYDAERPVVCFDETSTQLLADVREPLLAQPGRPRREDYEYRREGTRNLFLTCEPRAGWRHVAITKQRTMRDLAHQMRWLVDEAYPHVPVIRVVLDNPVSSTGQALNTHRRASLWQPAFGQFTSPSLNSYIVGRPFTRLSRRLRPGASPSGWSSTSRPSMVAG